MQLVNTCVTSTITLFMGFNLQQNHQDEAIKIQSYAGRLFRDENWT